MCDSVFTSAVTWVFSGCVHRAAHAHPVYVPCVLCGGVRVIFPPEPDAPPGGVKDQLPVDAGPRFADPVHRLLADELQRPGRGQRPPLKQLRVRGAAATARLQDRPRGSKSPRGLPLMAVRPSENRTLTGKSPGSLPRRLRISGAGSSSRPGVPGRMRRARKNSKSPGVAGNPDDRYRGLLGPVKVQGIDRHDARKFRLRRVPRVMHPARSPAAAGPAGRRIAASGALFSSRSLAAGIPGMG